MRRRRRSLRNRRRRRKRWRRRRRRTSLRLRLHQQMLLQHSPTLSHQQQQQKSKPSEQSFARQVVFARPLRRRCLPPLPDVRPGGSPSSKTEIRAVHSPSGEEEVVTDCRFGEGVGGVELGDESRRGGGRREGGGEEGVESLWALVLCALLLYSSVLERSRPARLRKPLWLLSAIRPLSSLVTLFPASRQPDKIVNTAESK